MTRQETIEAVCEIVGVAYNSIGDFTLPSDCFCEDNPGYQNAGKAIEYVRRAVNQALEQDGIVPTRNINEATGDYYK